MSEYAFRQDSDFFYLTGFNEPEGSGSFSATSFRTPFCPVCPTRNARRKSGLATDDGVEAAKELFGADGLTRSQNLTKLPQYLKKADRIYHLSAIAPSMKLCSAVMATYPSAALDQLQ